MKHFVIATMFLIVSVAVFADEPFKPPVPEKEHAWLKQLEGNWTMDSEATLEPGKPPIKCQGTESAKSLGGLWVVSEFKGDINGMPMMGFMTLGYDKAKKKYIGTWVCNGDAHMCKYEGTASGNALTLETEAPHPMTGKMTKMKDEIVIKDKDHKVLTSYMQGDDGKWTKFNTMNSTRKK